jgi:hypothetical protein
MMNLQNFVRRVNTQTLSRPLVSNERTPPAKSGSRHPKVELQEACRGLNAYIQDSVTGSKALDSKIGYFENKIVFAVQEWSNSPSSQLLHIQNQPGTSDLTITSEIAICTWKALSESSMPTISVFCDWESKTEDGWIMSLIYSLINQLVDQLEVPDGEHLDFNAARLQELDGTLDSWDKALSIFSDLLGQVPQKLYVIIDRIERLERLHNEGKYVSHLIALLRHYVAKDSPPGEATTSFKILLTTRSACMSISQVEDKALRTVVLNKQNSKRRPGEWRLGRSQIVLEFETEKE